MWRSNQEIGETEEENKTTMMMVPYLFLSYRRYHPSSFYTVGTYPHTKIQLYWMDLKNPFPPSFSSPLFLSSHVLSCSLFYSPVSSSPVISSMFSSPHISSGLEERRGEENRGEQRTGEDRRRGDETEGGDGFLRYNWICIPNRC